MVFVTSCRDELSHTEEQLAAHHVQYTQLQRSGANPEHICAEKIAEQQLRIKQVAIHAHICHIPDHYEILGKHMYACRFFSIKNAERGLGMHGLTAVSN